MGKGIKVIVKDMFTDIPKPVSMFKPVELLETVPCTKSKTMVKIKLYKIVKTEMLYSKKKGGYNKNFTMDKGLTLEEALDKSFAEYGNKNRAMTWRSGSGMLSPTQYTIK